MNRETVWEQLQNATPRHRWGYRQKNIMHPVVEGARTCVVQTPNDRDVSEIYGIQLKYASMMFRHVDNHTVYEVETPDLGIVYVRFSDDNVSVGKTLLDWK